MVAVAHDCVSARSGNVDVDHCVWLCNPAEFLESRPPVLDVFQNVICDNQIKRLVCKGKWRLVQVMHHVWFAVLECVQIDYVRVAKLREPATGVKHDHAAEV